MKIWYLTSEFPPDYGGGIGMYVDKVSKMFARAGDEVTVFVRSNSQDKTECPEKGLRYIRFQHCKGEIYQSLGYWAALSYQYAQVIKAHLEIETPDVIEVQEYGAIGYYLFLEKLLGNQKLRNIPIVLHLHTPVFELSRVNQSPEYEFPNYWVGQMEKFCMRAADAIVSPSQFLKEKLQKYAPNKTISVINLPYYTEESSDYPKRCTSSDTIIYGGRTEYRKGIYQAIKVFDELWSEGYTVKLKIYGGDPYFHPKMTTLGNLIKSQYSNRIKQGLLQLNDSILPEKLDLEFLKAKAVIVPSIYENFPYACVTAMWQATPMIVSKQGGQAEMVNEDGVNGFVFDWEREDLKDVIIRVLNQSDKTLNEIGENGKKRIVRLCNVEMNIQRRKGFYENAIKQNKIPDEFPFLNNEIARKPLISHEPFDAKKLSIIIPYYNLGRYIEETVRSAINSNYPNKEIIIVDDGSDQVESIEALDKIKNVYQDINVVSIRNAGLANARNVGAKIAKGEYITFLDADDLVDKEFYSKSIDILENFKNVSFVYSWVKYFENGDGVWPTFCTEFPYFLCANMLTAFAVVRKNDFLSYGLNRKVMEYGLEDYDGWLGLCENGYFGVSIPETLVKYRVRENSMSRQFNKDMRTYLSALISQEHSDIFKIYSSEIFNLLLQNGPSYKWNNPTFETLFKSEVEESELVSTDINSNKAELLRIANSKWGNRLIRMALKLKLNKLF